MDKISPYITPAIGSRFLDWVRMLRRVPTRPIKPRYWLRLIIVGAITLLSSPFQWYEDIRLRRRLKRTVIRPAPVFVIGHWRSGTTLLHTLLSKDEQFGYVTTIQSVFSHSFMTNPVFPFFTRLLMPPTRPMDEVKIYMNSPQEEEMALVNYGPYSYYHSWHFPSQMRTLYRRLVKQEGITDTERLAWRRIYLKLLTKTALNSGGRRLLLKSPTNTARLRTLLDLFPDARFIFIHRDPLEIYPSTLKLYRKIIPLFHLEDYDFEQVKKDTIWIFKDMLHTYLEQRRLVPENQLIEISYENLMNHPIENLRNIYEHLQLGDFEAVAPHFEAYLTSKGVRSYKKSVYDIPPEERRELEKEWAFAFDQWGS